MIIRTVLLTAIVAACAAAAACGRPEYTVVAGSVADCGRPGQDSAYAVCRALDTLARGWASPSRVLTVERRGDSLVVRTAPADSKVVDGMGRVVVGPGGRVLSAVMSDSL